MAFGLTDLKVRMWVVGFIARNAKNYSSDKDGWLKAEKGLCTRYKRYVSQIPRSQFLQRIEYMKHAGDLGRTPMSTGLMVFLFLLVAAESLGFSYLLGTWAASDGSAKLYTLLMYAIVLVLAFILARVTHEAGSQFYRTRLIRSCYARYKEGGNTNFHSTESISLSEDQFKDQNVPPETRCLNRIIKSPHDMGSYGWSWVAGIFVAIIFVLSGVMRFSHMEAEMTRESQAVEATTSNPFAKSALPAELTAPQAASDKKAGAEARASTMVEGSAAIIILGFIFVVTQIVGFGAGYTHCFAGKETYKVAVGKDGYWFWKAMDGAYADTWGYSTYESYWEAMQPYKDIANSRLKELQRLLCKNSTKNLVLDRTFDDFLDNQAQIAAESKEKQNVKEQRQEPTPMPPSAASPSISAVDKAKQDIDAIADKKQQQEYFLALPAELRDQLKPWLKERKEKAQAVLQVELNDLF